MTRWYSPHHTTTTVTTYLCSSPIKTYLMVAGHGRVSSRRLKISLRRAGGTIGTGDFVFSRPCEGMRRTSPTNNCRKRSQMTTTSWLRRSPNDFETGRQRLRLSPSSRRAGWDRRSRSQNLPPRSNDSPPSAIRLRTRQR